MSSKKASKKEELIVPDTSILISKKLTELHSQGKLDKVKILIPEFAVDELQAQANSGKEIGFLGLEEIKELRKRDIKLEFVGRKATMEEIRLAKKGRIDSLIRDLANEYGATLYTQDVVQALVAEVFGVRTVYLKPEIESIDLKFMPMLTKNTMSLHFKVGCFPMAKKGSPGNIKLTKISNKKLSKKEFEALVKSVLDEARRESYSFVEFDEFGAMILQIRDMRIAITRPPFSSEEEMTLVRPIVKLKLDDYKLSERLKERITQKAEGILIAGPPGSGKSTLAASIAEFYHKQGKIVKTMESPRDLQVIPDITQYGPLNKDFAKTAEILLLVRPDYTIFDEMRSSYEFKIFSDMRLAGVGMVGVVHAATPIDSVQRFIRKIELGMLPSIVDTILFIKDGKIEDVLSLTMKVKVPSGMTERDLARPVIEVRSFEIGELKYEVYTFGEETIVIPVSERKKGLEKTKEINSSVVKLISRDIKKFDPNPAFEIISDNRIRIYVDRKIIPKIIGKSGKKIDRLEEKYGIHIDVYEK